MLDLDATTKISVYALIWLALLLITATRGGDISGRSVGLPLAFVLSYSCMHGGVLVHLIEGYDPSMSAYLRGFGFDRATVAAGFEASCLGMIGALLGFFLADRRGRKSGKATVSPLPSAKLYEGSMAMLLIGGGTIVLSKLLVTLGIRVAGTQAVVDTIRNLYVVGACSFIFYKFRHGGERSAMLATAAFALATPAFLLLTTAILADSVTAAILIVCFYLSLRNKGSNYVGRNAMILVGTIVISFVFASFYLQSRQALRSVVWGDEGAGAAAQTAVQIVSGFNLDTIVDNDAFALIDARLNQNIFVGLAVQHLQAGSDNYESGATIGLALLGWIPRAVWPGKPERGGSAFLAKHTGLIFASGTTFGAGTVFEWFVNYGYPGVLIGFVIFGVIVRRLDIAAFEALRSGSLGGFMRALLIGIVLLSPLADLFFIVGSAAAAFLLGTALNLAWSRRLRSSQNVRVARSPAGPSH